MTRDREPAALPLLEESVHLLRQADATALCIYAAGTVPFCLGLFLFWARLTRQMIRPEAVAWSALGLALLYLVMKTAQADYCRRLLAQRLHAPAEPRPWRGWLNLAASQARTQPWALCAFWAGAATLVPLPWALAYGQSLSVLGDSPGGRREAGAQTGAASRQALAGFLYLLLIFVVVWLNAFSACIFLPWLAHHLLGLDNQLSRGGLSFFNPTFLVASLVVAWVAFDPLLKAYYTLRVFYGRALRTGEDLRVDLRLARAAARALPLAALLAATLVRAAPLPAAPAADVPRLDRAIEATLSQPEYRWHLRQNPEEDGEGPRGPLGRFFSLADEQAKKWFRAAGRLIERVWRWIFYRDSAEAGSGQAGGRSALGAFGYLLLGAAAIGIVALGFLVAMQIRAGRVSTAVAATAAETDEPPGLEAEAIDASRLPAAGWLGLAREQARRGEWRLALRAAYLATLAELAAREFIFLARAKTNLDYERELRRRAAARAEVVERFSRHRVQFEAVWYGSVPAGEAEVLAWIAEFDEKGPA